MITENDRRGLLDARTAAALLGMDVASLRNARARHGLGRGEGKVRYGATDLVIVAIRSTFPGVTEEVESLLRTMHFEVKMPVPVSAPGPAPVVVFDAAPVAHWVWEKVLSFRRGARRVVSDPNIVGGAPVFKGTRIPVEQVGQMLLKGDSPEELLKDFPALTRDDLEYARTVVKRGPRPGRPRKPIELRR